MDHERVRHALDSIRVMSTGSSIHGETMLTLRVPCGPDQESLVFMIWLSDAVTVNHVVVDVHGADGIPRHCGFLAPGRPAICPVYKHNAPPE